MTFDAPFQGLSLSLLKSNSDSLYAHVASCIMALPSHGLAASGHACHSSSTITAQSNCIVNHMCFKQHHTVLCCHREFTDCTINSENVPTSPYQFMSVLYRLFMPWVQAKPHKACCGSRHRNVTNRSYVCCRWLFANPKPWT